MLHIQFDLVVAWFKLNSSKHELYNHPNFAVLGTELFKHQWFVS